MIRRFKTETSNGENRRSSMSSEETADMVLLARNIAKQIESELEYPGQIKVNVIRESRVTDFAK